MRKLKTLLIISTISLLTAGCGGGSDGGAGPAPGPTFFTDNLTAVWVGTTTNAVFAPPTIPTVLTLTQPTSGNSLRNAEAVSGTVAFAGGGSISVVGTLDGNTATISTVTGAALTLTYALALANAKAMSGTANIVSGPATVAGTATFTRP